MNLTWPHIPSNEQRYAQEDQGHAEVTRPANRDFLRHFHRLPQIAKELEDSEAKADERE